MDVAPHLTDRFRAGLEALTGSVVDSAAVAVSGGPDSLALLLLAAGTYPGRVQAATVDHGLRPESAGEAAMVASVCGTIGVPHATLKAAVAIGGDGIQANARRARYAALAEWAGANGIPLLLTAHHADDQAETILMRLRRGSGVAGLSGVRPLRPEGESLTVARPLLGWSKAELAEVVRNAGLSPADDSSNRDERFDRVAMRRFLAENPSFETQRLARSAGALAEANDALDWSASRLFAERCVQEGAEWRIDAAGLPREMKRRLLHRVIGRIDPSWMGTEDVEGLLAALDGGTGGTLGVVMASARMDHWRLRLAPPRRPTRER